MSQPQDLSKVTDPSSKKNNISPKQWFKNANQWVKNNFWIVIIFLSTLLLITVGIVAILVISDDQYAKGRTWLKILWIILFVIVVLVPVVIIPYIRFKLKERKLKKGGLCEPVVKTENKIVETKVSEVSKEVV